MTVRQRLLLSSALMLFLELALIRWTGSNILHLSYFSNFVLLGSFLGIGLGFLRARPERAAPYYSPVALTLLVAFVTFFPVTVNRSGDDVIYFTSMDPGGPPIWLTLPLIFLATAAVLMGPGEIVGSCFHQLERLESYRLDLCGSLAGIISFTLLSFLGAPPLVWGSLVVLGYAALLLPSPRLLLARPGLLRGPAVLAVVLPGLLLVGLLGVESFQENTRWSPYYKIETVKGLYPGDDATHISVNGIKHQKVTSAERRLEQEPQYALPYQRSEGNPLTDVLVVGAGSGTDVAIALSRGARRVDAVEIDPELLAIGRESNPDRPYADPRVHTVVDDGRAFLERSDRRYDLILFALPDSLTLVSGASSLRLESYLFTRQAFEEAREHLKPGGAFAMYNYYREPWLIERLAGTAAAVFGHAPCVDLNRSVQAVITSGLTQADQTCANTWAGPRADTPPPATDSRPFLYLKDGELPGLYLVVLLGILLASLVAVRAVAGPVRRMRPYADLFALGVAFLLLETKSVAGFALLFGTTWVVNALVFSGVLVAVLAAVEVTRRWRTPPLPVMYGLLGASVAVAAAVPASWLLGLPVPARVLIAIIVSFLPIFTANVVFAKRFRDTPDPTLAFGANLIGAMVGGCLEYAALLVGYPALLALSALVYAAAFALLPRAARERASMPG
jgi:SAM-dependent methyltransferase